jgi:hypothetical protein
MKRQLLSIALAPFQGLIKGLKSSSLHSADKRKPATNSLRKSKFVALLGAGFLSLAGSASAGLIESIAALDVGDKYRVLFTTSTTRDATSSNIADYNSFVSANAIDGTITKSLGLTWTALASTAATNAQVNTGIFNDDRSNTVTMFNTNGDIVALSGIELWGGSLSNPLGYDSSGGYIEVGVFTGTRFNGEGGPGVTMGRGGVIFGDSTRVDGGWVSVQPISPRSEIALYGVSNEILVGGANGPVDVPEPGTVILLSLGLAGLSFARYRKQY